MRACMHVCMHACMHVCMYACGACNACKYVCMHACMHVCNALHIYIYIDILHVRMYCCACLRGTYACLHVMCAFTVAKHASHSLWCMHACMHACVHCMHVCMYVCARMCVCNAHMYARVRACMYFGMCACMGMCI